MTAAAERLRARASEDVPWVLAVELPYPPSVNHLYRNVGNRTLKSAAGRLYHERCVSLVTAARLEPDTWQPSGPLCVVLTVTPPDARRRDLDNILKAAIDGLCAGLGVDDSTIVELRIRRRVPWRGHGGVFAVITPGALKGGA